MTVTTILLLGSLFLPSALLCPNTCNCLTDGVPTVECHGGDLARILKNVADNTTKLIIVDATSTLDLKQSMEVSHLSQLQELTITKGHIQEISDNTFVSFANLKLLNLTNNNIKNLAKRVFSGLKTVETLDLSNNKIQDISYVFNPLRNLQLLDLENNQLTNLQTGTFRTQLNLETLKLSGNKIKNLHGYIFQGLKNLKILNLENCQLEKIPEDLFGIISNLEVLIFSGNRIGEVPSSRVLRKLPYLKSLHLDNNKVSALHDNQFSGIKLDILNLSANGIQVISHLTFKSFNTKLLDLSDNLIYDIDAGALRPTAPILEVLNLSGNPLQKLRKHVLDGLYRLAELNISGCSLNSLGENLFSSLKNLKKLDISWNNLKYLPRSNVNRLSSLSFISLDRNYWQCNCEIQPLRNWLQKSGSSNMLHCSLANKQDCEDIRCSSPSYLTDKSIASLDDSNIADCNSATTEENGSTTVVAIVVTCIVIAVIFCTAVFILWRQSKHKGGLRWICSRSTEDSSHLDKPKKEKPFQDLDLGSLNESDHSFVVRNYFHSMVQNPVSHSRGTPSLSQKDFDTIADSRRSLYSISSNPIGMESAV